MYKPGLVWERVKLKDKFNSLRKEKNYALQGLKAFADEKFTVAKMMISVLDRQENILLPVFSPFSTISSKVFLALQAEQSLCHGVVSVICLSLRLSVHLSFPCLRDKAYIFVRIFMKLSQFAHLINSFNPIDFQKKSDNKVAILS